MAEIQWHLKAGRGCTGQGRTPAQIYAGVATHANNIQPCEAVTCQFEGETAPTLTCPVNVEGLTPTPQRLAELASDVLIHLQEQVIDWPHQASLALSLGEFAETASFLASLNNELHRQGELGLAEWLFSTQVTLLTSPTEWQALNEQNECIWLSADALINQRCADRHNARLANSLHTEGLVLGEAAAALWLSRQPEDTDRPLLSIGPQLPRLTDPPAALAQISPFDQVLVNTISAEPRHQAAWYLWLARYETSPTMEIEQHHWLSRAFGCLGAASAAIGLLCALGRLNLPIGKQTSAWVVDQSLDTHFTFYRLEQGEHHVR